MCAVAAEVRRSKTVILHVWKDPESYGTKKSNGRPPKTSPALRQRIRRAVCEDTGQSSTQIKALTVADCSPTTRRQHLLEKGLKNRKRLQMPRLLPRHKPAHLEFAREHQTWDIVMCIIDDKYYWVVFYTTQWRRLHHDLGCIFFQWENGASGCAGASNGGWLCGHVAVGIPHDWGPSSVW